MDSFFFQDVDSNYDTQLVVVNSFENSSHLSECWMVLNEKKFKVLICCSFCKILSNNITTFGGHRNLSSVSCK